MFRFEGLSSVKSDENHDICEQVIIIILLNKKKRAGSLMRFIFYSI